MAELTLLFDGGCPLCLREVNSLRRRDADAGQLAFVDVNDPAYEPACHGGITYAEAMGRMHALRADGHVIRDVEVFRQAYALVNLGWLYAPPAGPCCGPWSMPSTASGPAGAWPSPAGRPWRCSAASVARPAPGGQPRPWAVERHPGVKGDSLPLPARQPHGGG